MALSVAQQSVFNSYRYLIGKVELVAGQDRGRLEDQIRTLIALGDTEYAAQRHQRALDHYLDAYSVAHRYLHPRFPSATVARRPDILLPLDALDGITQAVAFNARYHHVADLPPTVAPYDPPAAIGKIVDTQQSGSGPTLTRADLLFASGLNLIAVGEFAQAAETLATAKRSNRGQDRDLTARITLAEAATQLARGDTVRAKKSLDSATSALAELNRVFAARVASANSDVLKARLKPGTDRPIPQADPIDPGRLDPRGPLGVGRRVPSVVERIDRGPSVIRTIPTVPIKDIQTSRTRIDEVLESAGRTAVVVDALDEFAIPLEAGVVTGLDLAAGEKVAPASTYQVTTSTSSLSVDLTQGAAGLVSSVLEPRKAVGSVADLWPRLDLAPTFLAYIPHVYGYVLPMGIADSYAALGHHTSAVDWYLKALAYPHLNVALEGAQIWLKAARAIVAEADQRFRSQRPGDARPLYETVVTSSGAVPAGSRLYQPAAFQPMRQLVTDAVSAISARAVFTVNPLVAALVAHARSQLAKIDAGLNWLGLADDVVPIWSFDFLQSTARYFAQHAIQAWRQYISYRAAAESEELTQRELEQAVVLNEYAEAAQQARHELAEAQVAVSQALLDGAEIHRDNLVDSRNQFDSDGWVIAELNRFQAWYSNANLGGSYGNVHFDWGGGHELSIGEGSGQERIDAVIRYRNRLSHQMQIDNFNRQIAEAQNQIVVAQRQAEVAQAQVEVAGLELAAAEQRTEFARQNLEFFEQQEFTPDLWNGLADVMGEVAADYLDMGIYAAFLMERAYNVEHDRDLQRIRFDYPDPGGVAELTAGDSLLLDVDSFTHDLLMHVGGRQNQVRHVISLADFAPQAFFEFREAGVLEFTIPIDEIERAYPGSYLHRIQNVEVEVEGLQVPEGISGTLEHLGISSWRRRDGSLQSRVSAPESLVLSGFTLRRDQALFRVDPARLKVFENSGSAGSWRLRVPRDTNNVDFSSIFDVRLVLYFVCMHDAELEADIRATFPTDGEATQAFSARLHAPDQYFAFGPEPDGSDTIVFSLDPRALPLNHRPTEVTEVGISVLRDHGQDPPEPFEGLELSVSLGASSGSGTTDASGVVDTDSGAGPLAALIGEEVADIAVTFAGDDALRVEVADVHLFVTYRFDYR